MGCLIEIVRYKGSIAMQRIFLFLAMLVLPLFAADYFIAPDGDDAQQGTLAKPFATLMWAQKQVKPGDTVFVRGGTYAMKDEHITRKEYNRAIVCWFDRSGMPGKPIRYAAYQDEKPVFDFSQVKPRGYRVHAFTARGSWLRFEKLTIFGVQVTIVGHTQSICVENTGSNNVFDQLTMRDGQAIGFWLGRGSNNLVLNCDAYNNHDFTSDGGRGGNVDGFGFHVPEGCVNNVFRGCRAWFNSDDGFDSISTSEAQRIENCWAFYNGLSQEFKSLGDGNGFKVGGYASTPVAQLPKKIPRHVVVKSIAAANKASGFYANHQMGGITFLNNSAYRNRCNYNMLGRALDYSKDVPGYNHVLKNNVGVSGRRELDNINSEACDLSHNSFDLKSPITEKDFESVDVKELMRPRKSDGDLPDIDFMRSKKSSPLIDIGVDVGLPFSGKKPDLGAIELGGR